METIENAKIDAQRALNMRHDRIGSKYQEYYYIYRTTNENLEGVSNNFEIKDKKVLTICGSGDQNLMFLANGAESVTNFDINKLAYYYLVLKQIGFRELSFEDFRTFFIYGVETKSTGCNDTLKIWREGYFNIELYNMFKGRLPEDVKAFWDEMYLKGNENLEKETEFIFLNGFYYYIDEYVGYFGDEERKTLKEKLNSIDIPSFIRSDVYNINKNASGKYDLIYLSNVADYTPIMREWIEFVTKKLSNMLTDDGEILAHYKWAKENNRTYEDNGFEEICMNTKGSKSYMYTYKPKK